MMSKHRLWRVDISHIRGYHAPYLLVETTSYKRYEAEVEAIKLAKTKSRLSDYNEWNFDAVCLEKKFINNKWVPNKNLDSVEVRDLSYVKGLNIWLGGSTDSD
jgi:hypothetical protein